MEYLYIALVDTPGIFASLIRRVLKISYVHVVLSSDPYMRQAYSVGRRNPFIPFFAGFEKEDREKIARAFPTARYQIGSIMCTAEQKKRIKKRLSEYYEQRFHYHYCIWGLPFLLMGIPFYQKRHYTCSSFLARILEENGIALFEKHFSLVTPKDFYELKSRRVFFEGLLIELLEQGEQKNAVQSCETEVTRMKIGYGL